jgi:hypothetical protein
MAQCCDEGNSKNILNMIGTNMQTVKTHMKSIACQPLTLSEWPYGAQHESRKAHTAEMACEQRHGQFLVRVQAQALRRVTSGAADSMAASLRRVCPLACWPTQATTDSQIQDPVEMSERQCQAAAVSTTAACVRLNQQRTYHAQALQQFRVRTMQ